MSRTWPSWKSLSAKSVSSCSLLLDSRDRRWPLKSKRVPISLAACSTALRTSTRFGSKTVSKLGMMDGLVKTGKR